MRRLTKLLMTIWLGLLICSTVKASTELGRLASEFNAAWAVAQGPAPPLGIAFIALTENERSMLGITDGRGVRLTAVDAGSLGERIGLKVNDIVVGFNGSAVRSGEDLVTLARSRDAAATPRFDLFTHTPSNRPAAGAAAPQSGATQIDCGPNPTVECAMQLLRDSWSKLREAVR